MLICYGCQDLNTEIRDKHYDHVAMDLCPTNPMHAYERMLHKSTQAACALN
jgi:hypothetical protein